MIAGLDRRIVLLAPQRADDGAGGAAISYAAAATVWGSIRVRRAGERAAADDLLSVAAVDIRIRWRSDVRAGWRAAEGGKTYRVVAAADPDARRRWLDLTCEEEVR